MENKSFTINIKYIKKDSFDRSYYGSFRYKDYISFLVTHNNSNKVNVVFDKNGAFTNGNILKPIRNELRKTEGNLWAINIIISDMKYMLKVIDRKKNVLVINKALNHFVNNIELSIESVNWIGAIHMLPEAIKIHLLLYELEPTLFNQRTKEYSYRKGRIKLEYLNNLKQEIMRSISHMKDFMDENSYLKIFNNTNYCKQDKIGHNLPQ